MPGFLDLCESTESYAQCSVTIISYFPIYISIAFNTLSFYTGALYFWVLWAASWADFGINVGLRYAIQQPAPDPTGLNPSYGMPSGDAQLLMMTATMILIFMVLYRLKPHMLILAAGWLFGNIALFGELYNRQSTMGQLVAGGLIGVGEGVAFSIITHYMIFPFADQITQWWPFYMTGVTTQFLGNRYLAHADPTDGLIRRVRREYVLDSDAKAEAFILVHAAKIAARREQEVVHKSVTV